MAVKAEQTMPAMQLRENLTGRAVAQMQLSAAPIQRDLQVPQ